MANSIPFSGAGAAPADDTSQFSEAKIFQIIGASAVGTMIEWYDFYIFGSLATVIARQFYPSGNETVALLQTLATFGAGFAARPFGALVFGRIGDLIGRKYGFLITLLIMGGSTFAIGLLPGYSRIGLLAPLILVTLRLVQGLALGGEYGGAAVYVAEHVPNNRRGYYTSFIQTTATLGLFISLLVVLGVQKSLPAATWASWGWRIPFLLSIVLVVVSLIIRLRLRESPLFARMKQEGTTSRAPIVDSLGSAYKWQVILTVLWGATAGQAVVWYTGQFYTLSWLQGKTQGALSFDAANIIVAIALAFGTPFFIVFGALSDRIGRKPVMMAGNLIAALAYFPIFIALRHFGHNGTYQPVMLTLLVFIMVVFVTMVYGPIAAFLVESFPARVRYTSVSLPYHIGNGYFGGFLPFIATAIGASAAKSARFKDIAPYAGLIFPVTIALITFVTGMLLLQETKDNRIDATEGMQLPRSNVVLTILSLLTAGVLVFADQKLLPTLSTSTVDMQLAFRGMVLIILASTAIFVLLRRRRQAAGLVPESE